MYRFLVRAINWDVYVHNCLCTSAKLDAKCISSNVRACIQAHTREQFAVQSYQPIGSTVCWRGLIIVAQYTRAIRHYLVKTTLCNYVQKQDGRDDCGKMDSLNIL